MRAEPARRRRDRNLQAFGEPQQFVAGAAVAHALADDNHRPLGGEQHVDRLDDAFRIGAAAARNIGVPFFAVAALSSAAASMNTSNGTSSTTGPGRPVTMVFHAWRTASGTISPRVGWNTLLAIGAHGRGEVRLIVAVQFLEGAAIELAGRHVAGHRHERHRVEKGVAERDRQIGRAGPARSEGRGRLARDAVIDVGHEAGDALVMHRDGLDVVRALVQRVDELDIAVPAKAEDLGTFSWIR